MMRGRCQESNVVLRNFWTSKIAAPGAELRKIAILNETLFVVFLAGDPSTSHGRQVLSTSIAQNAGAPKEAEKLLRGSTAYALRGPLSQQTSQS